MKIHYKTIILKEEDEMREFHGDEQYYIIHDSKRWNAPIKATSCCESMKQALKEEVFYVQKVGNKQETIDSSQCFRHGMGLYPNTEGYEGCNVAYGYKLNYCPFCAEKIELVEDYKAKVVKRIVTIPEKKIKSRKEYRDYEVKVEP